ncbi:hypothetical protein COLO4_05776 [Corchorus olitorius]|uniref:VOC domain-containing protein n=1 Tax=Corchorus olitorius TaxID=93759 RepID=A0A1R3KPY2_9ROSI|nr:hypothetical protein COLO4_05776 [Corchorus olitorius]
MNHFGVECRSIEKSVDFYQNVLGFLPIKRSCSLDYFKGQCQKTLIACQSLNELIPPTLISVSRSLDVEVVGIKMQCESIATVEKKLEEMKVEYMRAKVEDGDGVNRVDQVYFHDPDGTTIELCNCQDLPAAAA